MAATGSADDVLDTGTVTVTGTTITANTQTSTAGPADGIPDTSTTTVTGSNISGNTATAGGVGDGLGILDTSNVTVSSSTVSGNTDTATGSGKADGTLDTSNVTMTGSQVVGNTTHAAVGDAGGTFDSANVVLTRSSVTGNSNSTGGGTAAGGIDAGSVVATNSTIANNTASGPVSQGGGIDDGPGSSGRAAAQAGGSGGGSGKHPARGPSDQATRGTTLVYSTVTGNSAQTGANIMSRNLLTAFGSVVALPNGGANCVLSAGSTSNGWNFSDDTSCGFTNVAAGDRQAAGDPMLAAPADNGGPGPTRLPLPGSPLVDAIPVAACQADGAPGITTDERGVSRPQGAGCDIGAVEAVPVALVVSPRFTG